MVSLRFFRLASAICGAACLAGQPTTEVPPGQVAEFAVEQGGRDLTLELRGADGTRIAVDFRETGPETAFAPPGRYRAVALLGGKPVAESVRVQWIGAVEAPEKLWEAQREATEAKRLHTRGSFAEAGEKLARAEAGFREAGRADLRAVVAVLMGQVEFALGDFEAARDRFTRELPVARAAADRWVEAECANNLGMAEWQLGEIASAAVHLEQALEQWTQLKHRTGQAAALSNAGILHRESGSYAKARDHYRKALGLVQTLPDRTGEAFIRSNLGVVLHALGEDASALQSYDRALALFRALGNRVAEARTLVRMARVWAGGASANLAFPPLRQALLLVRATGDRRTEAEAELLHGQLTLRSAPAAAADRMRRSLALYQAIRHRSGEASAWHGVAMAEAARGGWVEAQTAIDGAIAIRRSLGLRDQEADALFEAARIAAQSGRAEAGAALTENAMDLTDEVRSLVAGQNYRMSYQARRHASYDAAIGVLMSLHRARPTEGYAMRAFAASERARARVLIEAVTGEGTSSPRLAALRNQLNYWSNRIVENKDAATASVRVKELLVAIKEAEAEGGVSPVFAPARDAASAVKEIPGGALLLSYWLSAGKSHVWALSDGRVEVFALPGRAIVEGVCKRLRWARSGPEEESGRAESLRQAGELLLGPVHRMLDARRALIVVADGPLWSVPFAALARPGSGVPLAATHAISMTPSALVLRTIRDARGTRSGGMPAVAIAADPIYDEGDYRLGEKRKPVNSPAWGRLVYSQKEARAIAKFAPGARLLLGPLATRTAVLDGAFLQRGILHFAVHGLADLAHPELSALVLSRFDEAGRPTEAYLRAHEIGGLRIAAELVVLSACQSGSGRVTQGEGALGLARAFLSAGARAVLVNLWDVGEEPAIEMMGSFYSHLLTRGRIPASEALRLAQMELAKEPRWRSPQYWGGWVLHGDGQ